MQKVTAKGQITVPKSLRDKLGIKTDDYIQVVIRDGKLVIELLEISVKLKGTANAH